MTRWLAILLLVASPVVAQTRGYQSRACGFDLNFNGVAGEAADCNVCDGTTTDVDGNAVTDDLRYVDCDGGTDSGSCTAGSPCATVDYAMGVIGSPSASQIQAICVTGTCSSSTERTFTVDESGASGTYTRTASGSEEWDFEYPRYPLMIVGWDTDDDGEYPPYDADDTAVFDGNDAGNRDLWFNNGNTSEDRIEVSHLEVNDYLQSCADSSVIAPFPLAAGTSHLYFHDMSMDGNGQGCSNGRFIQQYNGDDSTYHAYENLNITNFGGFIFWRGSAANTNEQTYARFKNLTIDGNGGLDSVAKVWEYVSSVEFIDSVFSGDIDRGVVAGQCTQTWVIRNNLFDDVGLPIDIQSAEVTTCNIAPRPVDDVIIDRNTFLCDVASCYGDFTSFIQVGSSDGSATSDEYVGDLTVTNNFFWVDNGAKDRGILFGLPQPGTGTSGTWSIINNTFDGSFTEGALVDYSGWAGTSRVPAQWYVRNNLFSSLSTVDSFSATLSNFSSSGNLWQTGDSADEVSGSACGSGPTYVSQATGNLHLAGSDTCALDAGSDPSSGVALCSSCVDVDIDGGARPVDSWDIGADEFGALIVSAGTKIFGGSFGGGSVN